MRLSRCEPYEFAALAAYNAERARGIMHTTEYAEQMAREQERFDAQRLAEAQAQCSGIIMLEGTDHEICDACCQRPAAHSQFRFWHTPRRQQLCCECWVAEGNPPADWHPACMAAYQTPRAFA